MGVDWRRLVLVFGHYGQELTVKDFINEVKGDYLGGNITEKQSKEFLDYMVKRGFATKNTKTRRYTCTNFLYRIVARYGPSDVGLEHLVSSNCNCSDRIGIDDAIKNGADDITYDFSCWRCKQKNVTYVPKGNDLQIAPHKSPKGNDCDGGVSLNESYGRIIIKRL